MEKNKHVQVGEINLPVNYFTLTEKNKEDLCHEMTELLLATIIDRVDPNEDTIKLLHLVLDSSIMVNEERQNYEICGFLKDMKTFLDE